MCVYCHLLEKKLGYVGRDLFIYIYFFILKYSEFGFLELLFVLFLFWQY
jgi:hypothetical protein